MTDSRAVRAKGGTCHRALSARRDETSTRRTGGRVNCGGPPLWHPGCSAHWHPLSQKRLRMTPFGTLVRSSLGSLIACGLLATSTPAAAQSIGSCPVLPADNIWNTPIDTL